MLARLDETPKSSTPKGRLFPYHGMLGPIYPSFLRTLLCLHSFSRLRLDLSPYPSITPTTSSIISYISSQMTRPPARLPIPTPREAISSRFTAFVRHPTRSIQAERHARHRDPPVISACSNGRYGHYARAPSHQQQSLLAQGAPGVVLVMLLKYPGEQLTPSTRQGMAPLTMGEVKESNDMLEY